jgi:hypothetical protein
MINQKEEVRQDILDKLDNGYLGIEARDLHHELCNTDYFIIGTYKAKQFLGAETFEIIELIKEYEQDNFGEVSTDFSNAEKVANMFAYIVGEEILNESKLITLCGGKGLQEEDIKYIKEEISN